MNLFPRKIEVAMKTNKLSLALFISLSIMLVAAQSYASDEDLFSTTVPPDALIILDMSGSMNWDPAGNPASSPSRRIDIAKSVIFDLLDDNDSGTIDGTDDTSLNVRLGYMRFRNIGADDNDDGDPFNGNIRVFRQDTTIGQPSTEIGAPYSDIWKKVSEAAETAVGCTPLGATFAEGKKYFKDDVNPQDTALACRLKYIIFVTDGSDTVGCHGDCSENAADMWKRRMLTVQRAKEAHDAGLHVFAVGFGGNMPDHLKKTLNWVAKYGGTDNSLEDNVGDPTTYDISKYIPKDADGNDLEACSTTASAAQADPANYALSGYAFLADNADQLSQALKTILKFVRSQPYYITIPSIPSVRLSDQEGEDNVVYISSFVPNDSPFWKGFLKKYRANPDGSLPVDQAGNPLKANLSWDASDQLINIAPNSRNIRTYVNGAMTSFIYGNLTNADLDVASDQEREDLVNHVRGVDAYDVNENGNKTETREWKLGDIFHSNPVIVGSPSRFFEDTGFSGPGGFYEQNKNRTKVIIAGANDGMLHAFNAVTGNEEWAFIPNSLLKTLKSMKTAHTYYVDGSPKVADVWFDLNNDNKKAAEEWRTVLVCGLRKGGKHYFALDITDTLNPKFLWEFPKTSEVLNRLGQSWSDPAIGKVKIEQGGDLVEKWVAFIGGGFDPIDEKKETVAATGRVFFVIDIMTGEIIKEFSGMAVMDHSFPAPPAGLDATADGYVDKVYIGDLGGQMWVFNVSFDAISKKSNSQWSGQRLFVAPGAPQEKHNIYYQAAIAFDNFGNPWVYFGTGNREDPTDTTNPPERFYAVMDDGKEDYPRVEENNLRDVTNLFTFSPDRTKKGWFMMLEKTGKRLEKVLGKPTVFNKLLYFTTYFYNDRADPCSVAGDARLYVVDYVSGGGAFVLEDYLQRKNPEQRWQQIGSGVASSPVITVNMRGQDSVIVGTTSGQVYSAKAHSPSTLKESVYWREVIP
jgi:type IV pilus assembly protein PilY1